MIRFIFLALPALIIPAFSQSNQQVQPESKRLVIPGSAEIAEGCPVSLSDANFVRLEHSLAKYRFEIVQTEVKIHNLSERKIRRLMIGFEFENSHGGSSSLMHSVDAIGVNENHRVIATNMSIKSNSETDFGYFSAKVLSIEFEDRSHWVAPRSFWVFPLQSYFHQHGPLTVRMCEKIDSSYEATLRFNSDEVMAYRLGVVRDTINGFEVRLGDWVYMPASPAKGSDLPIKASDENASLTQDRIFPLEEHSILTKSGIVKNLRGGVSIFVAEAKLMDGKIWSQSLKREDLLYDN